MRLRKCALNFRLRKKIAASLFSIFVIFSKDLVRLGVIFWYYRYYRNADYFVRFAEKATKHNKFH